MSSKAQQKAAAKQRAAKNAAKKSGNSSSSSKVATSSSKSSGSASYKNSSSYKSLSPDSQKLTDLYSSVSNGSSQYSKKQLKDALSKAKKDSSGYMKQLLREYETQTSADVAAETGDYQSHLATVNENIKEINDDLTKNSSNLSLTEQQDLAKQARDYEQTRGQLINDIANNGTTFSSIGDQQKSYAEATNQGIVESTTTQYNKQLQDLKDAASRGNIQAQQQLSDYNRTYNQNINTLGLKAETYLGTDKLKSDISGLNGIYNPLGNISGQFKEDTTKDIQAREETYLNQSSQGSLNF